MLKQEFFLVYRGKFSWDSVQHMCPVERYFHTKTLKEVLEAQDRETKKLSSSIKGVSGRRK